MAITVTATMSGANANEHIYLWIRVLTGATETGGASAAGIAPAGGTGVTASLTPNGSHSLPCYALTADNWGGAYTAAANNTIDSSSADPDTWGAGFGRYTGTVTASTPLTFGASGVGGSCDYGTWACYELLASGGTTPAVDSSSPALASATGAGVKTVTSASFTPPSGAVLVAMVCAGGTGTSGAINVAITDTSGGSLTWTQRAGNPTVTDQSTFVFTATSGGPVSVSSSDTGTGTDSQVASQIYSGTNGTLGTAAEPGRAGIGNSIPGQVRVTGGPTSVSSSDSGSGSENQTTNFKVSSDGGTGSDSGFLSGKTVSSSDSGTGSDSGFVPGPYIVGLAGGAHGYFVDQFAVPRLVWGDAAWALPGNAGRWSSGAWQSDFDTYLTTRAAQGVNVIYTKPMGTQQSGNIDNEGGTFDSLFPFQGGSPSTGTSGANPSSGLTAAYWARFDYFLNSAKAKGITVFVNAIGYSSDFDSGPGPLAGKSTTEFTAYGTALGTRYAGQPNIVWNLADDYFGDNDTLITAFLTGLRGAGDTHVVSIENFPETMSRFTVDGVGTHTAWGFTNAQYNFVYSYNVIYYGTELGYTLDGTVPVIAGDGYFYQGDATYSGGSGAFAFDRAFRQDAWHALSSGARGKIHGDEAIWQWASTSQAQAASNWFWANSALPIRSAVEALPGWQNLIPDTSSALVTSGRGTHASAFSSGGGGGQYEVAFTDSYVTASVTPDGTLALIYMSHGSTIGIATSALTPLFYARRIDPVNGQVTLLAPASSFNSTAWGNNSAGDPDWALALVIDPADGGTGTETQSVVIITPVTNVSSSDTGTGSEAQGANASLSSADTGSGSETQGTSASLAGADTGSGSETQGVSARVAAADTGTGSDTQLVVSETIASSDTGTGSDTGQVLASTSSSDTGTGTDTQALLARAASADTGTGSETQSVPQVTPVASSDTGTGTDTQQPAQAAVPGSDTGTGSEAQSVTASLSSADSAAGTDAGLVGSNAVNSSDTGTGSDTGQAQAQIQASDTGAGSETQGTSASLAGSDTGTGSDTGSVGTPVVVSADTGTGSEAQTATAAVRDADSATGSETQAAAASVASSDSGTGSEAQGASAAVFAADTGSGSEAAVPNAALADRDSATGSEAESVSTSGTVSVFSSDTGFGQEGDTEGFANADSATGSETQAVLVVLVPGTDTGLGTDAQSLFIAVQAVSSSDTGTGTDTWTTTADKAGSDTGTGTDTQALLYEPADSDAATGSEQLSYAIGVYPYPPPWLYNSPGGGYRLVFRPGTVQEQVVHEWSAETRQWDAWEQARTLLARLAGSETLVPVTSSDTAAAFEGHRRPAGVRSQAHRDRVECEARPETEIVMTASPIAQA